MIWELVGSPKGSMRHYIIMFYEQGKLRRILYIYNIHSTIYYIYVSVCTPNIYIIYIFTYQIHTNKHTQCHTLCVGISMYMRSICSMFIPLYHSVSMWEARLISRVTHVILGIGGLRTNEDTPELPLHGRFNYIIEEPTGLSHSSWDPNIKMFLSSKGREIWLFSQP